MTAKKPQVKFDIKAVFETIPHRYPFLLVDRVLELKPGEKIVGLKNVTINEPFFQGHFPGEPVMPGVLILEALAQAGAILMQNSVNTEKSGRIIFLGGIEKARFRRPVVPGDQLLLEVVVQRHRGIVWKVEGKALVDGLVAAEAVLMASEGEPEKEG